MKKKVWDITVKDNPNRVVMGENDEFYTTDTEAYLVFKLDDEDFNPATAVLTLENRNDGSLKNETVDVVDGLIEWEMPQRYIEHFGNWQGQLVYEDTKDGQPELYTSATFTFVVNAHIGDKKKPSLVEIENWEKFIRDGTELIETWEDLEALREENERQRQENEQQRQDNYQELLDTGVLQTNINNKLEQLEENYTPQLAELKENDENLTAQLAQNVNKNPIYLTDYGVSHEKTATENTALIKQAIADASQDSRPIIVPWVPSDQWIDIDERLIVKGANKITGYGVESRIRQTNYPEHIFELQHPDASVEDVFLSGVDFDASSTRGEAYRGTQRTSYFAGVVAHSDRNKIRRIKVDNMVTGVLLSAWDIDAGVPRTQLKDCIVDDIEVSNVTFGLVVQGVEDFYHDNIRGSYKLMPGTTTPPHLVYFDGANGNNINIVGGTFTSKNGIDGQAFQYKSVRGGSISKLTAESCDGVLNVMDSIDLVISEVISLSDNRTSQEYGSLQLQGENRNVEIKSILIKMNGDGKPFRTEETTFDSRFRNIKIQSNHTLPQPADSYDFDLRGDNNVVENIDVKNIGVEQTDGSIGVWRGNNNVISNPKTYGNRYGVVFRRLGDIGNILKNYNPEQVIAEDEKLFVGALDSMIELKKTITGIGNQDRLIAYERSNYKTTTGALETTTSGHDWIVDFGRFRQDSGRVYSDLGLPGLAFIDVGTSNIDFSAGVKLADREGLAIRAIDKSNLIGVWVRNGTGMANIFKYDSDVFTSLAEVAYPSQIGRRYCYKVKVFDDKIDFFVDGEKILSHTFSAEDMSKFGSVTNHGIYTRANPNGMFDNLEWRSIE